MNIIDKKTLLNIIYNDLEITKDDLWAIIMNEFGKEARQICRRQFQKLNPDCYTKNLIEQEVKNTMRERNLRDKVIEAISKNIRNSLEIKIREN